MRARTCILPAGIYLRVSCSARSRSRRAGSGGGRSTSRSSGCSPWSSCSGSRALCPLYARSPTGAARGPRCSARSSAFYTPLETFTCGPSHLSAHAAAGGIFSGWIPKRRRIISLLEKVIQAYHGRKSWSARRAARITPQLKTLLQLKELHEARMLETSERRVTARLCAREKKNAKRTKRGARRRNRLREQTVQTESRQRSALIGFDTTLKRQVALEICPTNAQAQRVTARGRCHGIRGLEEYRVSSRTFIKPLIQGLINCIKNHFNI